MSAFNANDLERMSSEPVLASPVQSTVEEKRRLAQLAETLSERTAEPAFSPVILIGFLRSIEFSIVVVLGTYIHSLYQRGVYNQHYFFAILSMALLTPFIFQALRLNDIRILRAPVPAILRLLAGWTLVFMATLATIFLLKLEGIYSRVWLVALYVCGFAALAAGRMLFAIFVQHLTRIGRLDRRAVLVGGGPACSQLVDALSQQADSDLRICGIFDDRADDRSPDVVAGYPKLGNIDDLVDFARHTRVDLIIFALPITAETRILQMLRKLWVLPIDIRLSAYTNKLRFRPRSYSYIGDVPVLDVFDKPIADRDVVVKAAFDRFIGLVALIIVAPVLLAVAIAIKLDSRGPIFFRQKRHGFNNEPIDVWKFRSMYVDRLEYTAPKQATRDDPRVTPVGRFIRRTSLDELPQLFNVVFFGNLSLVGPRPHPIGARTPNAAFETVVDGYFARHHVKPGITGWAQINGWRGETGTPDKLQKRIEHDLHYIENWSIFFDVYILARTPFTLLDTTNAY